MNLILLENKDFIDHKLVVLKGRRFTHLTLVNKVMKNDQLKCGLLNGKVGKGLITKISNEYLEMNVCLDDDPPKPLPITIVLALPRPKMLKRKISILLKKKSL